MELGLTVEDLSFGYGSTEVLREITLPTVKSGEVTALVGPNATGKSTLLKCIAGIHTPNGTIRIDGKRSATATGSKLRSWLAGDRSDTDRILYTPQETPPASSITVFEAVLLARQGQLRGRASAQVLDQVGRVLARLRMDELAARPISDLSGGQRQLISLAQAVIREPDVLLLDEPTSNLDLRNQLQILTLIQQIARTQPAAVVITVHDLALAARFADQIVVLHQGSVHSSGTPRETITEQMLREVYLVDATVHTNAKGVLSLAVTQSL
ncbi:ABC transporter ATP-binding protein [Nocardia callitridis]|uniref:ABC transporter ATP-binding protein n=1 Tax=Nocardia callitridis TaxID=648753 RepID=A0ABP9JUS6_9NOCA